MKKIISIILVLCFIFTVGVSANTTVDVGTNNGGPGPAKSAPTKHTGVTGVTITYNEEKGLNDIDYKLGDATGTMWGTMVYGDWTIYSPDYDAEAGTGSSFNFATIKPVEKVGKTFVNYDLHKGSLAIGETWLPTANSWIRLISTIHPNYADGYISAEGASAVPVKFAAYSGTQSVTAGAFDRSNTDSVIAGKTNADGSYTYGRVKHLTMYAYTTSKTGLGFTYGFTSDTDNGGTTKDGANTYLGGAQGMSYANLYSENGIPHKIDFFMYSDSVDGSILGNANGNTKGTAYSDTANDDETLYIVIYIDGLYHKTITVTEAYIAAMASGYQTWNGAGMRLMWYQNYSLGSKNTNKTMSIASEDQDAFVEIPGNWVTIERDALSSNVFQSINYYDGKKADYYENVANGVVNYVDTQLEDVLKASGLGEDRIITLTKSAYESPAKIWYSEAETSNVSLVNISTGDEITSEEYKADNSIVSGNFDNYYMSINGVYVKAVMGRGIDITVDYDKNSKTVIIDYINWAQLSDDISFDAIVVSYDSNGAVDKLDVVPGVLSKEEGDGKIELNSDIAPTEKVVSYKVFMFDSLKSAKPMAEPYKD